jgi:hypothetical protein
MHRRHVLAAVGTAALLTAAASGTAAGEPAGVLKPPPGWKLLYASDDPDVIKKLRVSACVTPPDPTTGKYTTTVDALKPGEQPSGNCVTAPVPQRPASRHTVPADTDPGPQSYEQHVDQHINAIPIALCRHDAEPDGHVIAIPQRLDIAEGAEDCIQGLLDLPT